MDNASQLKRSRVRCAIYTRKSTEEGLDQEFNSLQAQREAAEAYIRSQKHLGWALLPAHYDDGGFSGGNLERPALQKLLADVQARQVDCVVVYKVDRLSRSLLDFARLIHQFDERSVSFVSVTQQFNTTTSLGRLTLNILLSFAQFEREIIGERTRDKMAAARRKGKWIGGTPMLGYDVDPAGGRLVVNEKEAYRVREIYELFQSRGSLQAAVAELQRRNWRLKSWTSQKGVRHRGRLFSKASLRRLLTNAVYAGKVEYRGVVYAGEHAAIVDAEVWDAVNAELRSDRRGQGRSQTKQNALLAGVLRCGSCQQPMLPTYTSKGNRRYRYYVCRSARRHGWKTCPTKSVSAATVEASVIDQLRSSLADPVVRQDLNIDEPEWTAFLEGNPMLVRSILEQVIYDAVAGRVRLQLRKLTGSQEAQ
jgi:site-specific DNA recombinase